MPKYLNAFSNPGSFRNFFKADFDKPSNVLESKS